MISTFFSGAANRARRLAAGAVLAWAWAAALAAPAAPIDVPTWRVNEEWDFERLYNIAGQMDGSALLLNLRETYTLRLAEIANKTMLRGGIRKVYRRTRSNGTAQMLSGTLTTADSKVIYLFLQDAYSTGEQWNLVSDLALARRWTTVSGTLKASTINNAFFSVAIATFTLELDAKCDPPMEDADFPLETVGETWTTIGAGHIGGRIQIAFDRSAPIWNTAGITPPDDVNQPIDGVLAFKSPRSYAGPDPKPGFADAVRIVGDGGTNQFWYSPAAKEFAQISLDSSLLGGALGSGTETTKLLAYRLLANPNIQSIAMNPPKVELGGTFVLSGKTAANKALTATLLDGVYGAGRGEAADAASASTVSDASGNFSVTLDAPRHGDSSPASADGGSFGVEIAVTGVGTKVATVQLVWRQTQAGGHWERYE